MENNAYIGNIGFKCTEEELYRLFSHFGSIKRVKVFSLNFQGFKYPVGYACIQFLNNNDLKQCISYEKKLTLHNKKLEIYSTKPETTFSRSIFVTFSSDIVNEEFILSVFRQSQPSKISFICSPSINNYGFSIVEFSTVENRDIALYDYFRSQSYNYNSSNSKYSLLTVIEPTSDLIELSLNNKSPSYYEESNELYNNEIRANFNENYDENSPKISFLPTGVSYFENKYYERYLDLLLIHKNKEYRVNSLLASTFSMRIKKNLMENSIKEKVETRFDKEGPFELVSNSLLGLPIDITNKNSIFLFVASSDLGIDNLRRKTYGYVFNQMTIEKAFDMHRYLRNFNVYEGPHSDFLSLNFDKILTKLNNFFSGNFFNDKLNSNDELHELYFLAAILRSKYFTTKNPRLFSQTLFEFIKEKEGETENKRRSFLIQFLKMNELELEEAQTIVDDETLNLNQISEPIFSFLKEKSKEIRSKIQSNQFNDLIEKCLYQNSMQRNHGVFSRLSQIYGGNLHDLNIVNLTAPSPVESIIDTSEHSLFEFTSPDIPDSWICFDFYENSINLTAYAIKYSQNSEDGFDNNGYLSNQLTSWKIEGSDDFENWTLIEERRNVRIRPKEYNLFTTAIRNNSNESEVTTNSLKKRKKKKNSIDQQKKFSRFMWKLFELNDNENLFRFIKITQIDKNGSDNYRLKIQGIEFYGSIPDQQIEIPLVDSGVKFQKGIFSCMFDLCDGANPVQKDLISICSSSDIKFLIDENYEGYWSSPPIKGSFIKIDLKKMKLELKSYSIKCHDGVENGFISSWKVEVSNDDKNWILVDIRENRNEYKSSFENYVWECKLPFVDPIRYIRIVNISDDNLVFCIANIELYGILHRPLM